MSVREVRVRGERHVLDRLDLIGRSLDGERAGSVLDVLLSDLEEVCRDLHRLLPNAASDHRRRRAGRGVDREAYVPSPYGVLSVSPCITLMSSGWMPSSSATIWANVVS